MLLSSEPGERVDALHRLRQLEDGNLQKGGELSGSSSAGPESIRRGLRVTGSMRNKNSLYPQLSCPPDFAKEELAHSPQQRPLLESNTKRRLTQNKSDLTTTHSQPLPTPITRKPTVCGVSYECGRRPHMEDVVVCTSTTRNVNVSDVY